MLKIYHNPRCKKSCEGVRYLKDNNIPFTEIRYLESGITLETLNEFVLKLNCKPIELIRTQEELYKKELKGRNFTDNEWLKIIADNPRLLIRPIIVGKYKAVWAQPASLVSELLPTTES